ncbi:MAG: hypothetical protein ACR2OI_00125 [Acidimicrobiia bacterium]
MRIAYVASHIPLRRELAAGPIDAEWILEAGGDFDVTVFADYQSEGTDLLEEAGIHVSVSPKRTVTFADGAQHSAEEFQARLLLDSHLKQPFDAIVHDSARTTDWAWYQSRLEAVPRGIALGAGPIRDVRVVTAEPGLFAHSGRVMWAATGALAAADFLVSDAAPESYGLIPEDLPPTYSLADLPTTRPPTHPVGRVAVVALSEGPAGLVDLVERAELRVQPGPDTTFVVIHPDIAADQETTRDIVRSSLPTRLVGRVEMAEPSSDGVAAGLLSQVDAIVAARPSDLTVKAVADRAREVAAIILEGAPSSIRRLSDARPTKAEHPAPILVPSEGPLADLVPTIDGLAHEESVIIHTPEATRLAQRLWRLPGVSRVGLVTVCDTGPYLGEPDPARIAFNVLGFRMEAWPSVRRLLHHSENLHELVEAATSLTHAGHTNFLALPMRGSSHGRLSVQSPLLPAWVTTGGILPTPNLAGLSSIDLDEPDDRVDYQTEEGQIRRWAETHGFRDRVRLALPWKWGLLNRAMKDRW